MSGWARTRTARLMAGAAAGALLVAGCGGDGSSLAGAGASSQEIAMQAWLAGFYDIAPDVLASYEPVGSGAGREMFINGSVQFAGTDAFLDEDEAREATERCHGGDVLELPLYISPIAVAFHLPGLDVEHLQLEPEVVAAIFDGQITAWDDDAIAATNLDVELPDLDIIPVNRSDDSGTTENFTEYLAAAGGDAWPHEPDGTWPRTGTQSGQQNAGVVSTMEGADGTIGYLDASQVTEEMGTVAVGVAGGFVPFSPEAAALAVEASAPAEGATDTRLIIDLDRDPDEEGAYPIVLVSYTVACARYDSEDSAQAVAGLLGYIVSDEAQQRAAAPDVAGSAPVSGGLQERITAAIDRIEAVED